VIVGAVVIVVLERPQRRADRVLDRFLVGGIVGSSTAPAAVLNHVETSTLIVRLLVPDPTVTGAAKFIASSASVLDVNVNGWVAPPESVNTPTTVTLSNLARRPV
jgi:hypothetical protein